MRKVNLILVEKNWDKLTIAWVSFRETALENFIFIFI